MGDVESETGEDYSTLAAAPILVRTDAEGAIHKHDAVFLVSNGRLSRYSDAGELIWQVETSSSWSTSPLQDAGTYLDPDAYQPSVNVAALDGLDHPQDPAAHRRVLLALGDKVATLVNFDDGYILATVPLPNPPLGETYRWRPRW